MMIGGTTPGVERVGDTVRRPPHARSAEVRAILRRLADAGFEGAPRFRGVDEHGREIFDFIEGEVVHQPADLSDARLRSAAELIRRFHDATARPGSAEVVCHGDLGPHNTVFAGDRAVAVIDWDDGVRPGARLTDLGHAVWCFAAIAEPDLSITEQGRRAALFCDAYGWPDRSAVVDEIAARFDRALAGHRSAGRPGAAAVFADYLAWMDRHRPALEAALR